MSQTNYFLLQGQILSQGEKGEAGRDFLGGSFRVVWQYVASSEKRERRIGNLEGDKI